VKVPNRNSAQPRLPDLPVRSIEDWGLKELERIRLILRGGSVLEWRRLHFRFWDEVDRFLRLCQIDPSDPIDEAWVRSVLADSVEYLRRTFNYRVAEPIAAPKDIHDLFLFASGAKEPRKYRKIACVVLKVMHVIQHIEGRDLMFKTAVSESDLFDLITTKVMTTAREAREKGLPIVDFGASIKTRESVITKLMAKKESVAATIYDRARFRIVTKTPDDILPVLYFLTQRLFPFNFVVPMQVENSLINFKDLLEKYPGFGRHAEDLHLDLDYENRIRGGKRNRFSGSGYKILNFVVDVPIRLDAFLPPPEQDKRRHPSRIGFCLVEFQIADEKTARNNETGDNSHERYKARQKRQVLRRLSRGLVVPKRKKLAASAKAAPASTKATPAATKATPASTKATPASAKPTPAPKK
jgi:uncharacterized protein (TIGR04552 family)